VTLAEVFADYLRSVYPGQIIEGTQLTEVRRAFYAGAWTVLSQTAPSELNETTRVMVRDALQFNADVKAGIK
jgi:hypothetical protein